MAVDAAAPNNEGFEVEGSPAVDVVAPPLPNSEGFEVEVSPADDVVAAPNSGLEADAPSAAGLAPKRPPAELVVVAVVVVAGAAEAAELVAPLFPNRPPAVGVEAAPDELEVVVAPPNKPPLAVGAVEVGVPFAPPKRPELGAGVAAGAEEAGAAEEL